jgi:hypothetical protein
VAGHLAMLHAPAPHAGVDRAFAALRQLQRSSASGTSSPVWASKTPEIVVSAICVTCSCVSAPDRSRASLASAPARRSRSAATRASWRSRAVSWPQTRATPSIRLKVNRYCVSLTLKELRGGTK